MPLPQTNATLTLIESATAATGDRDDWDTPGGEPTGAGHQKWAGVEAAYVMERVVRVVSGSGEQLVVDRIPERSLVIPATLAADTAVGANDVVTFTGPAGEETRRVTAVRVSLLPGVPIDVQTAKLTLDIAAPAA